MNNLLQFIYNLISIYAKSLFIIICYYFIAFKFKLKCVSVTKEKQNQHNHFVYVYHWIHTPAIHGAEITLQIIGTIFIVIY